jgi:hypothetical protein
MFARLLDAPARACLFHYTTTFSRQLSHKLFAHVGLSRKKKGANPVLASILPNFLLALDASERFRRPPHGRDG